MACVRPAVIAVLLTALLAGCGSVPNDRADAPLPGPDAPPGVDGPDAGCVDGVIFAGGVDPAAQGWVVEQTGFATVTMPSSSTTQLETMSGGVTIHRGIKLGGVPTGAFTGGLIGSALGWGRIAAGEKDLRSLGIATLGSIVVLLVGRLLRRLR